MSVSDSSQQQDISESCNVFVISNQTKGVIHVCDDVFNMQQGAYGQDSGFTLAMYQLPENSEVLT